MLAMVVQLGNQTMDKKAMLGITDEFGRSLLMQAVACKNERAAEYLLQLATTSSLPSMAACSDMTRPKRSWSDASAT